MQQRTVVAVCIALLSLSAIAPATVAVAQASPTATVDAEGDAVTLHPAPSQSVVGETSLDPGQEVTVRLRSSDGTPFLLSNRTTVGQDGRFVATFDLTSVEAPANATASVVVDGERIADPVAVQVVEPESSTAGQLGFGVVAALGSLLVAALVGWRHRE